MTTFKTVRSVIWVAVLGLCAGAAGAGTTTCPTDPSGFEQYFEISTASGAHKDGCWDYGDNFPYDATPTAAAPTFGDAVLQIPTTFSLVATLESPSETNPIGTLPGTVNGLTIAIDDPDGDGESTTGTFWFDAPLAQDVIIAFKAGKDDSIVWGAFRLFAGFVSGPEGSRDTWKVLGTGAAALSNVRLYSGPTDQYLVPIPAAAWLLGSGLLGLFAVGRRRKAGQVAAA